MSSTMRKLIDYLGKQADKAKYKMDLAQKNGSYGSINIEYIEQKATWYAYLDAITAARARLDDD